MLKTKVRVLSPGPSASAIASDGFAANVAVGFVQSRHGGLEGEVVAVERHTQGAELLLVES